MENEKRPPLRTMLLPWAFGVLASAALLAVGWPVKGADRQGADVGCAAPTVIDGDTLRCGRVRIRLSGIDAPELPGHCRRGRDCTEGDPYASTANLMRMVGEGTTTCRKTDTDRYGRTVALCSVRGRDLSCSQVEGGFAVRRYARLAC